MKKSLLLISNPFSDSSVFLNGKRNRSLWFTVFLSILMLPSSITAQSSFCILPTNSGEDGAFQGPYSNNPRRFQMLIAHAPISTLTNKYLTSISFRLQDSYTNSWPLSDTTFSSYEIYLSKGVTPSNMQMNFAANINGTQTMVKSGSHTIPAGSIHGGNSITQFNYTFVFDTPYLYTGGNLVIEIRHTGSNNPNSIPSKAVYTNSSLYGTYFSACWEQNTNITLANFSYIKINAEENLGVKSATIDNEMSIFPNPSTDYLHVKSSRDIAELHVLDAVGRKVLSQKSSTAMPQLEVRFLAKGVYILEIIYKDGSLSSAKFVKD